jgi:glycosyltransferase involved in cell wall biosynthesis
MSHTFCIITGGYRPDTLKTVIKSIRAQNIPEYEIIVVGKHHLEHGIVYIESEEAAVGGRLSEMRNKAVTRARYENIVILDDDIILSPDWYAAFLTYNKPFDILTSQVRVPDGSRYVDHASIGGPKGNIILIDGEEDDNLYMTGGGGWVMKKYVSETVRWDEARFFYEGEDVDFSRRCQEQGFRISHNHRMLVFHADPTYTCIGRIVARRQEERTQEWLLSVFDEQTFLQILRALVELRKTGRFAEAADYLRMGMLKGPHRWLFKAIWGVVEYKLGGKLPGINWYPSGDPAYLDALEIYDGFK